MPPVSLPSLVDIISKNKNKKVIAKSVIETNPSIVPVASKLVASKDTVKDPDRAYVNRQVFMEIHNSIVANKINNKNIVKLFPDIELAIQILTSSILSPKKMTDIQLNYKLDNDFSLNNSKYSTILASIEKYIEDNYKLESKLPDIIREALFETGAYVVAVLPESSVDDVINSDILATYSTEDFKLKIESVINSVVDKSNILKLDKKECSYSISDRDPNKFIEFMANKYVKISDNSNLLKYPSIKSSITKKIITNDIRRNASISVESMDKLGYMDIFRERKNIPDKSSYLKVKKKTETKRKSIGKPMVVKLPTESVIPVYIPGNKSEHIGYFVLTDQDGRPIEVNNDNLEQVEKIASNTFVNISQPSLTASPIQKAYNNLVNDSTKNINTKELFSIYRNVIEAQLYESVKNSIYGSNVEIGSKNDIYFLMFTRALADQHTNLLFIPKELVNYIAFYYNDVGYGKTLLENLTILSSLRAILLFSKVMAYTKQAIDVTKVNVSLDPNDPDPEKTIEQIQDGVFKIRQNFFPLGINNPIDLVNWIQRAGLQFAYENHPGIPNIKLDFENANLQHTIPNSDFEEDLRKQTIIALGLSPETIDNGFSPEFATSVVNNNILLSKRISVYQLKLEEHLHKLLEMFIYNDESLRTHIRKEFMDNIEEIEDSLEDTEKELYTKDKAAFIEHMIDKLAANIYIDLPDSENTNLTNLSAEFELYKDNLEKVVDAIISQEALGVMENNNISIDAVKGMLKSHLIRKWMANNNYYTEILDIASEDEEVVSNMLASISSDISITLKNSIELLKNIHDDSSKVTTELTDDLEDAASVTTGSSNSEPEETESEEDSGLDESFDIDEDVEEPTPEDTDKKETEQ